VDGFGENSLIAGKIVAAHLRQDAVRRTDVDDQDTLAAAPILAYVAPGRYAVVDQTHSFPFPAGFRRRKEDRS
jgi:hypothetical protein